MRVVVCVAFAYGARDGHVNGARVALHVDALGRVDSYERDAEDRAAEVWQVRRVHYPPGGRLAHDLPQMKTAITFREVLRVRERVLIRDERGRKLKRALAEDGARGRGREAARSHAQIALTRDNVYGVDVDEASVVVSYV